MQQHQGTTSEGVREHTRGHPRGRAPARGDGLCEGRAETLRRQPRGGSRARLPCKAACTARALPPGQNAQGVGGEADRHRLASIKAHGPRWTRAEGREGGGVGVSAGRTPGIAGICTRRMAYLVAARDLKVAAWFSTGLLLSPIVECNQCSCGCACLQVLTTVPWSLPQPRL